MDTDTAENPPQYKAIADCELCLRIPQKVAEEISVHAPQIIPAEVDRLLTVVEVEDESTPAYCTSLTRILKCPFCGTLYYYNHYDDDGQHFMDPTCDEITVRRYDLLTAMDFLEGLAVGSENTLPHATGQLKKAFVEGTTVPASRVVEVGQSPAARLARSELEAIRRRYTDLIRGLGEALQRPALDWHIQRYALESLCHHYLLHGDWEGLQHQLLQHPDPVVRVSTATHLLGIATGDAPVIDLAHVTRPLSQSIKIALARKARRNELAGVLLEAALSGRGTTLDYDHGYGTSSYSVRSLRSAALYGLLVAADYGAKLTLAIPALVALLSSDKRTNREICRLLRRLADKSLVGARAILDALPPAERRPAPKLLDEAEVKELVDACHARLKKAKPATAKTSPPKPRLRRQSS